MFRKQDQFIDRIYKEFWNPLYIYAYKITKDHNQTQDIIQEVFIDLWKRYDSVDIKHIKAYLYKAVKYKSLKFLNTRNLSIDELEFAYSAFCEQDLLTPEQKAEFKENLLLQVQQVSKELIPRKCYEVFYMRFYNGKSYLEIAELLNISENTVKNHISKALHILRENIPYSLELFIVYVAIS